MTSQSDSAARHHPTETMEASPVIAGGWHSIWVFGGWCLRRETLRFWPYVILLIPVISVGIWSWFVLGNAWYPSQGTRLFEALTFASAFCLLFSGARYGSMSVCGELHQEQLDLVRLTGINPLILLWCRTLARWWTIALSLLIVFPLAMYARTLGRISTDHWFAGICALIMLATLVAGFSMIASVSNVLSNNPRVSAPKSTFHSLLLYHCAFQVVNAIILGIHWCFHGTFDLPRGSRSREVSDLMTTSLPLNVVYHSIVAPDFFSPFTLEYGLHFLTGASCFLLASWMICKLFQVTSDGVDVLSALTKPDQKLIDAALRRPRCGDRPFFWKDAYVLQDARKTPRFLMKILSVFSLVAVIGTTFVQETFLMKLVSVLTVCLPPFSLVGIFDELLAVEFREQTWVNLMVLPVDRRCIVLDKIRAAAQETRSILPVGIVASAIAGYFEPATVFMTIVLAPFVCVVLIEVSILNHLNSKFRWSTPIILALVAPLIILIAILWSRLDVLPSFLITIVLMLIAAISFYIHLDWRLRTWMDT